MTIQTTRLGKASVIKLGGRLDAESTIDFNVAWESCVENGALHLVLDLAELQYISSAGLGSVVRLAKQLQSRGGSVSLCGVKGLVREVFQVTNLLSIFRVFDSPEAACQSL
jgi:anti-anti-sigma factor